MWNSALKRSRSTKTKALKKKNFQGFLDYLLLKRPPGPSFEDLTKALDQGDSYLALEYPLQLSKKYGEIIYLRSLNQYLITGAKGIEHILKLSVKTYTKSNPVYTRMFPFFGKSLLVTDGSYWKNRRHASQPAFLMANVKQYIPIINSHAERLVEDLKEKISFKSSKSSKPSTVKANTLSLMNNITLNIAFKLFCSLEFSGARLKQLEKRIQFCNWYISHAVFIRPWKPTLSSVRFHWNTLQLNRFLLNVIREHTVSSVISMNSVSSNNQNDQTEDQFSEQNADHLSEQNNNSKQKPYKDLLTELKTAKNEMGEKNLTEKEILNEFKTLILTGHETTACGLTWALYLLAENPEYQERLAEELATILGGRSATLEDLYTLPLLRAIVSETFRLYPPIWAISRTNQSEDTLYGYTIPEKSLLVINFYALHRNPEYWENPTKFYPERFMGDTSKSHHPYAYLPFSTGPRVCIANNLATIESMLTLATLIQQFRFEKYWRTKAIPEPCISLRPKKGLWLKIKKRDKI